VTVIKNTEQNFNIIRGPSTEAYFITYLRLKPLNMDSEIDSLGTEKCEEYSSSIINAG